MKDLRRFLKCFIFAQLGSLVGFCIKKYHHFTNYPLRYTEPWYYSLTIPLIITAVAVTITVTAYFVVSHIIKKREQAETE